MKIGVRFFAFFVSFFLFSLVCFVSPAPVNASVLFHDNFENGTSKWQVVRNIQWANQTLSCMNGVNQAQWIIDNGMYGIKIHGPACITDVVPTDGYWSSSWQFYVIEADIKFVSGTDKNIAWRYNSAIAPNPSKRNLIHFVTQETNPSASFYQYEGWTPAGSGIYKSYEHLPNGNTYHFRIEVRPGRTTTYRDGELKLDALFNQSGDQNPFGKLALEAGTGAFPFSEVYFDNVVVCDNFDGPCEIPPPPPPPSPSPTPIPYFGQNDQNWGNEGYDSTASSIGDLGCALTAAAMVLNGFGLTTLPNGLSLTPLTLNQWLIDNGGYGLGGGLIFPAISRLSKLVVGLGNYNFEALKYSEIKPVDYTLVDDILTSKHNPLIFKEIKAESPSGFHFDTALSVVVSGLDYLIHDPVDANRTHFLQPPDQLVSVRYFEPVKTDQGLQFLENQASGVDLSALMAQVTSAVDMLVTDPVGSQSGELVNEINYATYTPNFSVANYQDPNKATEPIDEFEALLPLSGKYTFTLSADQGGWYDFWLTAFTKNGEENQFQKEVYLFQNDEATYFLDYDGEASTATEAAVLRKDVSFDLVRQEFESLYAAGDISNRLVLQLSRQALLIANQNKNRWPLLTEQTLEGLIWVLNQFHPEYISDRAHTFMIDEISYLIGELGE